jgi:hypothetical protein
MVAPQDSREIGVGKTTVDRHLRWWELRSEHPELGYGETVRAIKAPTEVEETVEETVGPETEETVDEIFDAITAITWARIAEDIERLAEGEHTTPSDVEVELLAEVLAKFNIRVVRECGITNLGVGCTKPLGHEVRCSWRMAL